MRICETCKGSRQAAYLRWQQSYARLIAAGHPPEYAHRNASASDQEDKEAAE